MRASSSAQLLTILARLHPTLWEVLHPHVPVLVLGPSAASGPNGHGAEVELNPQPVPPGVELRLAVQRTATAIADAAIAAQVAGQDAGGVLQDAGDDFCQTPHRKIPWPRHWPHPWPDEPYPIDPELAAPAVQVEAALVFQSYAAGIADERLASAFAGIADRLIGAALETPGARVTNGVPA
ncbi:MAG: hypothetical protein ACXVVU_18815 [Solirubrobacteraceae bacterium]